MKLKPGQKITTIGVAFVASMLIALSSFADSTSEQPLDGFIPDHYLSYKILSFYQPFQVFLKDQFIAGRFYVRKPIKLLNPSDKLHLLPDGTVNEVRVNNPRLHYIAHEIAWLDAVPVTKTVRIANQFEEADISLVTYPDRLLAPAAKRQYSWQPPFIDPVLSPGMTYSEANADAIILPIPDGSHYLCYPVENKEISTTLAVFRDQFWATEFSLLRRSHICNPAIKRHKNKVYETDIHDPYNHLVCYDVDATQILRKVLTRDQFGIRASYVYLNDEICVPTKKMESTPEIPCGEIGADGMCPVATVCPENTICSPAEDGSFRCICR